VVYLCHDHDRDLDLVVAGLVLAVMRTPLVPATMSAFEW
jgi:hypothetical protein